MHQFFDMPDRLRSQKRIRADITHFGRHILEHEHLAILLHRVHDQSMLVMSRAALYSAFHSVFSLVKGSFHFGCFGSYTVMIIARSNVVVHTTWRSLPISF